MSNLLSERLNIDRDSERVRVGRSWKVVPRFVNELDTTWPDYLPIVNPPPPTWLERLLAWAER